jgi:hemolysin III
MGRTKSEIDEQTGATAGTVERVQFDVLTADRPSWRGVLHAWAFFLAIPAGVLLIVFAGGAAARAAASVYTATLLAVFGTSAAYHRLAHSYRARRIMQRLDHSMIYLLIAGTYVPICLVALPTGWGVPLLSVVGAFGLVGMIIKLAAIQRLQWLGYALYPIMGWAAVAAAPALGSSLSGAQLALIVAGGIAYSVGFPVLLLRRPDPWPRVFGYHEVWHGFTVVAAVLHFGAVALVVA